MVSAHPYVLLTAQTVDDVKPTLLLCQNVTIGPNNTIVTSIFNVPGRPYGCVVVAQLKRVKRVI